jgi:hypothetical protein
LNDWQVWQYLAVYFAASIAITIYLIKKDPAPLARRMSGAPFAEKEPRRRSFPGAASAGLSAISAQRAISAGASHLVSGLSRAVSSERLSSEL